MKYILLFLVMLSLSGCSICWLVPGCDKELTEEAMATRNTAKNSLDEAPLFWPVLDFWILNEHKR